MIVLPESHENKIEPHAATMFLSNDSKEIYDPISQEQPGQSSLVEESFYSEPTSGTMKV